MHIYIFCELVSEEFIFLYMVPLNRNDFKEIYLTMDENLTGTTTQGQSGTGSNGNEKVLHRSDAIECYTRITLFCVRGLSYSSAENTLSVLQASLTDWGKFYSTWC